MNVREWLRSRTPRPPTALAERLDALISAHGVHLATSIPESLEAAGDLLLADLLRRHASSRDSALDLLTADALMTYMMESAAAHVVSLSSRAELAMSRISVTLDEASSAE